MKSVLISIQPKWCELIASGKKTVEVRKTKPKLEAPFKVYIYCTKGKHEALWRYGCSYCYDTQFPNERPNKVNGKVIGEFVCDYITGLKADNMIQAYYNNTKETCLTDDEIKQYANNGKLYYWHISNLVIYDKPRGLYEFYRKCEKMPCEGCEHLKYQGVNSTEYDYDCEFFGNRIPITRPPQSWCYVEGV